MKIKFLCMLVVILTHHSYSQSLPLPTNIQSPTAANLGKYGDSSVSFNTGAANINVPLYSLEAGGIPMDISLSYNSSGVMVYDLPSWVGQNWSLNAGGVITRQINYYPDELFTGPPISSTTPAGRGYFYAMSHERLNVSNWSDLAYLETIELSNNGMNAYPNPYIGKDSQPDIFTFNFMGHTGKFFLGEDGEWKVASESNLKVEILESDFIYPLGQQNSPVTQNINPKSIGKIVITDDRGIKYTFGFNSDISTEVKAIEFSKNFFNQRNDNWFATSWYLVKVTNPQNSSLYDLVYERDAHYTASFYHNEHQYHFNATYNASGFLNSGSTGCDFGYSGSNNGNGGGPGSPAIYGSIIAPVYLKTITSATKETLTFNSIDSPEGNYKTVGFSILDDYIVNQLNYISQHQSPYNALNHLSDLTPYNTAAEAINKLKFRKLSTITSNFKPTTNFVYNTSNLLQVSERLNLVSISIVDKKYSFEYDRFNLLPPFLSKAIDHLGYFRGIAYPSPATFATHHNYRTTDPDKVKIGSLKKIIYPTKGFTEYEYEAHNYSRYVKDDKSGIENVSNTIIGGLRLSRVKNNDDNGVIEIKDYKYIKDYALNPNGTVSSGIITNLPKYYWVDWRGKASGVGGTISLDHFSTNPIIPLGNYFGSPISYDEVAEVKSDGSYTIYKFTGHDLYKDEVYESSYNVSFSPFEKYSDRSLLRGKLKSKEVFDASNTRVAMSSYIYDTSNALSVNYARGTNITSIACNGTPGYGFYLGNAYRIYYFDNDLTQSIEIVRSNGQELKTESNYTYEYYPSLLTTTGDRFLSSKTSQVYLQNGMTGSEKFEELYSYPYNFTSTINSAMLAKRIIPRLQTILKKNNDVISTNKVDYDYFTTANYLFPKNIYTSKGSNALEITTTIDDYDARGNILQFHNIDGLIDGLYTNYLWGYNSHYPIAKLEGAKIIDRSYMDSRRNEISTLLGSTLSNWSSQQTAILAKLALIRNYYVSHLTTTYTYRPFFGVTSITDPTGIGIFYTYDSSGRLITVKDAAGKILSTNQYQYKP